MFVGFSRVDANKMTLCAENLSNPPSCSCKSTFKTPNAAVIHNHSAAICCVACCLQKDVVMQRWNKKLMRYIMDVGKALYRRCIKSLRLKSNQYVGIDEMVPCFYFEDIKLCIKLEEALRGKMDPEIEDEREKFKCCIRAALATGDSYILTVERNNIALWNGDLCKKAKPLDNPACNPPTSSYVFDPQSSSQGGTKDCTPTCKKGTPCLARYTCLEYMLDDTLEIICGIGRKRRSYVLTKFSIDSHQSLERNPAENTQLRYMHHHCKEAYIAVAQMLRGKKHYAATLEDPTLETDNLVARGSGFFLNPLKFVTKQEKACHCRQGDGVELKGQVFLLRAEPDCPDKDPHEEEEHSHFTRAGHQGSLMLEGSKSLIYYKECWGFQGLAVIIEALKRIDVKKASSWDRETIDDIVLAGSEMYMDYRRASCSQKRPTLLGLTRCVGGTGPWGGWAGRTAAWGRAPGLPLLVATLLANNGRGVLQYPGKIDMGIWKQKENFYAFIPCGLEKETQPARLLCYHSESLLASALADLLPSAADVCVARVDFSKGVPDEPMDEPEDDFRKLCGSEKRYSEVKAGLPVAVGLVALAMDHAIPASSWEAIDIDDIVKRGLSLFEETVAQSPPEAAKEVCLGNLPKTFAIEEMGFVETEVIHRAANGLMYCPTDKSDTPNLQHGLTKFFKDSRHGVLTARGKSLAIWKGTDGYLYCLNHAMTTSQPKENETDTKRHKSGISGIFCLIRLTTEEALSQYVESELPLSTDDSFSISAVNIQLLKINKETGLVDLKLEGEYIWVPGQESNVAVLRSWECPRYFTECSLPVSVMFGCASCLLGPNRMTGHHLSSLVECGTELGRRLRSKYGRFDVSLADMIKDDEVSFGIHAFSIAFGPKKYLVLDKAAGIDYTKKITENKTPMQYNAASLNSFLEAVFQWRHCQQLLLAVDQSLCLSLWRAWPGGPCALLHPQAYMPPLPDEPKPDIVATIPEVDPEVIDNPAASTSVRPAPATPKGNICVFLYPALSTLAKHIGTILPYGFTEGRLTAYPLKVDTVAGAIVCTPEPPPPEPEEEPENPMLAKNMKLIGPGMWVLVGETETDRCTLKGQERRELDFASSVIGIVVDTIEPSNHWDGAMADIILEYGEQLFLAKIPGECEKRKPFTVASNFFMSDFKIVLEVKTDIIVGDIRADDEEDVVSVNNGLISFFGEHDWDHGVFISRNFIVGVWKMDKEQYAKYRYEKKFIDFRIEEQLQKDALKAQRAEEARKLIEGETSEVLLPSKGSKEGGETLAEGGETLAQGGETLAEGGGEEGKDVEGGGDIGERKESIQQEKEQKSEKAPSDETIEVVREPSQEAFYSDEYDVPPDMVDVIKAAEVVFKPPEKPAKGKKGAAKPGKKEKEKKGKKKNGKEEVKVEPPPPPEEVRERKTEREVEESQESIAQRSEVEDKGDSKTIESKTSIPAEEIKSEAGDSGALGDYGADEGSEFEGEGSEEEDEGEEEEAEVSAEVKKDEGQVEEKAEEVEEIVEVEKSEMEILSIHGSILSVMEHILEGVDELIEEDERLAEVLESEFVFEADKCILFLWDPHGFCTDKIHMGYSKPTLLAFANSKSMADFIVTNTLASGPGTNRFTLTGTKGHWRRKTPEERAASPRCPERPGTPGGGAGCHKAEAPVTAYVHTGGGRDYLVGGDNGCRCKQGALRNSVTWSIAAVVMRQMLDISLWSSATLDDIACIGSELRYASEKKMGCDFVAKKGVLHPSQVVNDFLLEKKHVHFELEQIFTQNTDTCEDVLEKLRLALEGFFAGREPLGILYTSIHGCSAIWKSSTSSKQFLAVNWPKEYVLMYNKPENLAIGYLTTIQEMNQCATEIKLFKVYMTIKNNNSQISS